jgi:hypothetical protein
MVLGEQVRGRIRRQGSRRPCANWRYPMKASPKDKAGLTLDVAKTSTLDLKIAVLSVLGGGGAIP